MSVFYWGGYVLGVALVLAAMAAPLLLVPRVRRRVTWPVLRPLLRRVTGRRPGQVAALERELAGRDRLTFMPAPVGQALTYQDIERARQKFLAAAGQPPVVLPSQGGNSVMFTAGGPVTATGGGGGGSACTAVTHSHGPDDPCSSDCRYV